MTQCLDATGFSPDPNPSVDDGALPQIKWKKPAIAHKMVNGNGLKRLRSTVCYLFITKQHLDKQPKWPKAVTHKAKWHYHCWMESRAPQRPKEGAQHWSSDPTAVLIRCYRWQTQMGRRSCAQLAKHTHNVRISLCLALRHHLDLDPTVRTGVRILCGCEIMSRFDSTAHFYGLSMFFFLVV